MTTGTTGPQRIWVRFTEPAADGAQFIRKWDTKPFDGATEYLRIEPRPEPTPWVAELADG